MKIGTPPKQPVVLSWSGGKDSAMALHRLRQSGRYEVVELLTTVAAEYDRVSHHGVRAGLLDRQAEAVGVPLRKLYLSTSSPDACTPVADGEVMTAYENLMRETMLEYKSAGVSTMAFGDIFLVNLRQYRETKLAGMQMQAVFPLWQQDTSALVRSFVELGFRALLSCVDAQKLGRAFAGRPIDDDLIRSLPSGVDPCGEYGEYHSFVYDGPIFRKPVGVALGEIVLRDTRYFAELLPSESRSRLATCPISR